MADLDDVVQQLAEIEDALLALPTDAFAERYDLQVIRDDLREQAATFRANADAGRSDAELVAEHAALIARLDSIVAGGMNVMAQGMGGPDAAGVSAVEAGINQRIQSAQGADQVRSRLASVEQALERRGIPFDRSS